MTATPTILSLPVDNSKMVLGMLDRDKDGAILSTVENFYRILANDNFFKALKLNTMSMAPCRVLPDGRRQIWEDSDDADARRRIENVYRLRNVGKYTDALRIVLSERRFSPAQDIIRGLEWDGMPHCDRFFVKVMRSKDSAYTREVGRLLFAQLVHRAFDPGCKVDSVVVLRGSQGCGKSTLCRWLALDDELYASVTVIEGQKGYEAIQGKLVCELEELIATAGEGTKKENQVKAFVTTQSDFYRRPYDRRSSDNPRHCVFLGTTNMERFLTDPTGNRRWFPIDCRSDGYDLYQRKQEVHEEIRLCYAEMYHAYIHDLPLAAPVPNRVLFKTIRNNQSKAEVEDYRIGLIAKYLQAKTDEYVCCVEIWQRALHFNPERRPMSRTDANELGEILRLKLGCASVGKKYLPEFGTQHVFRIPAKLKKPTKNLT